jgi:hypothetical protein
MWWRKEKAPEKITLTDKQMEELLLRSWEWVSIRLNHRAILSGMKFWLN